MSLEREEMVEILSQIAREGTDGNRIRASATLMRLQEGEDVDSTELERLIGAK